MKYDWIFFDADGTLFDYEFAEISALKNSFENFGIEFNDTVLNQYKIANSRLWKLFETGDINTQLLRVKRFEDLFTELKINVDPQEISDFYLLQLSKQTKLLDGSEELLKGLHGKIKMLLVTNGLKEVQRPRFNNSTIIKFFEGIVVSDEIGVAKPQKEYFDYAFKVAGNPPKEKVLMVGDSLSSDIKGGNDYGIDTCIYIKGEKSFFEKIKPKFTIGSLRELLNIVNI